MFVIKHDKILLLALDYVKKKSDPRNSAIKTLLIVFATSTSYSDHLIPRKRHGEKAFLLITMYYCRGSRFCSLRFSIQDHCSLNNKWLRIFFGIDSDTFKVILLVTCAIKTARNTNEITHSYKKGSEHLKYSWIDWNNNNDSKKFQCMIWLLFHEGTQT